MSSVGVAKLTIFYEFIVTVETGAAKLLNGVDVVAYLESPELTLRASVRATKLATSLIRNPLRLISTVGAFIFDSDKFVTVVVTLLIKASTKDAGTKIFARAG